MYRFRLLLFLGFWKGAALVAIPLHVDVRSVGTPPADPLVAVVRAAPHIPAGQAGAPAPVRVTVPGRRTLDLGAGTWRIQGEAVGYWIEERIVSLREEDESTVELRLFPTGTLRGRIELPRGQKPPDRLDVRFGPATTGQAPPAEAAKGMISCPIRGEIWDCALPAGAADLRLRAEAFAPIYRWGIRIEAGRTSDLGGLTLKPGASVVGRVFTEAGEPASGIRVEIAPERLGTIAESVTGQRLDALVIEERTNPRGFFQFQGVAPGIYAVTASSPGMAPAQISSLLVREGLEADILEPLVLARPVTLRIDLSPALDPYGKPWKVRLFKESNTGGVLASAGEGEADREGRWVRMGVAPGRYRVQVLGDLESHWVFQDVELFPGDVPVPIEIPVVEIRGLLTIGDVPLAGTLWFGGSTGHRRVRFDADEEGIFLGYLPGDGTWAVDLVSESEGLRLALEPVEVRVPKGKRRAEVEVRVPDTTLEGEVLNESGKPVPGALIHLTGSRKFSDFAAGADGRFRVRGLAPPYVFVEAEKGDLSSGPIHAALVEGRESPRLRLVLRSNLEIRGRVVSVAGPVPGAEVLAWPALERAAFASDDRSVTGPDGTFHLRFPAQARALTLFVSAPGHAFHMGQVFLEPGRPQEILIENVGGTLVLELPAAIGAGPGPAPLLVHGGTFTPLLLLKRWADMQRVEQTDPHKLVIPNVESGSYSLCLNAGAELRQGKEPPAGRCASGVLYPNGELTLSLAQP